MATARIPIPPHPAGSRVEAGVVLYRGPDPHIPCRDDVVHYDMRGEFRGAVEDGGEVIVDDVRERQRVMVRVYDPRNHDRPTIMFEFYKVIDGDGNVERTSYVTDEEEREARYYATH